ncbi:vacuolar protein sorting-associated protein 72 homolog [Anneissia japonica]|uniref:vacuolar protein sorting-associated protein 72 homolog n=1 Tax=Anneissia japonica TaxID=1529436 RepID=UPI00142590F5|nr:vacuolar protein sorting-associated protein 72 homolog [Anneissia japonica]
MSLASGREKRVTAGNRLDRMLAEEADDDDFYKTTYGGFSEEVDDNEYESEASGNETSSDSDISASEDDEPESDNEDEGPKRKRRVVTKAYKEPPKKVAPSKPKVTSKSREKTTSEKKTPQKMDIDPREENLSSSLRKSSRRSTIQRVTEFKSRIKEREERAKKMKEQISKKNMPEVRRLTQEELLKEAKKTEIENIASLKAYQLLEESRKKQKFTKQVYKGPTIKYRSMSMPFVQEIAPETNSHDIVVDNDSMSRTRSSTEQKKCSRNFITFSDVNTYNEYFTHKKMRSHGKQICPVTRLPAKYLDPITNIPYATIQAFKLIRETYVPDHTEALLEYRKTIKHYPQPKAS